MLEKQTVSLMKQKYLVGVIGIILNFFTINWDYDDIPLLDNVTILEKNNFILLFKTSVY